MTDRQKKICAKYGKRDADGFVHCAECPLLIDKYEYMCKANSVYNRRDREWILKDVKEEVIGNDGIQRKK